MLIDLDAIPQNSTIVAVGSMLTPAAGQDLAGKKISDVAPNSLLGLMLLHLPCVELRYGRGFAEN
jgi:hypothetical protein